jgi:uncharacterized membrane protein YsdA (DUF1294 family)
VNFPVILTYLSTINIVAYLMFAWDKRCAQRGLWRVSEINLLALAVFGGALGALAGQKSFVIRPARNLSALIYG